MLNIYFFFAAPQARPCAPPFLPTAPSSKIINEAILDTESSGERKYVGGEFIVEGIGDKNFTCGYNLYFQDAQENFFKESAKTGVRSLTSLESKFRDELKAEKVIKFDIPKPDDEARAEYELNHSKPQ